MPKGDFLTVNLTEIVVQLIHQNKFASELTPVSREILSRLQESILVYDREEAADLSVFFQIFSRREENLRRQGVKCVGLAESLAALTVNKIPFRMISFARGNTKTDILINMNNDYLLGMFYMPDDKSALSSMKL